MRPLDSREVGLVAVDVQCLCVTTAWVVSDVVLDDDEGTAEEVVQHTGMTFAKSTEQGGFAYNRAASTKPKPISMR
jgi:hypothetical protein